MASIQVGDNNWQGFPYALPGYDPAASQSQGLPQTSGTSSSFFDSLFSNVEEYGSAAWHGVGDVIQETVADAKDTISGAYGVVKTVVGDAYGGVKTVVGDVGSGAESVVDFGFSRMLLWLAVGGTVLYFVLSTGALKANVSKSI